MMANATQLIAEGAVSRIGSRSLVTKAGKKMEIVSVLIIGDETLVTAELGTGVDLPTLGEIVRARVSISVFNGNDQARVDEWL
jgi:hypothetical protein